MSEAAHVVEHVGEVDDLFHVPVGERGERGKSRAILDACDISVTFVVIQELIPETLVSLFSPLKRFFMLVTCVVSMLPPSKVRSSTVVGARNQPSKDSGATLPCVPSVRNAVEGKAELVPRHEFVLSVTRCAQPVTSLR